jgi:hypothetical protein
MMPVIYALMWDEGLKYRTRNDEPYNNIVKVICCPREAVKFLHR